MRNCNLKKTASTTFLAVILQLLLVSCETAKDDSFSTVNNGETPTPAETLLVPPDSGEEDDKKEDDKKEDDKKEDDKKEDDKKEDDKKEDDKKEDDKKEDDKKEDDKKEDDKKEDDDKEEEKEDDDTSGIITIDIDPFDNPFVKVVDTFKIQAKNNSAPIDFVWAIDNSRSMQEEQDSIAQHFNAFIGQIMSRVGERRINFHILTTDPNENGVPRHVFTNDFIRKDLSKFIEQFKQAIRVGVDGHHIEQGLRNIGQYLPKSDIDPHSEIIFIVASDENDQSPSLSQSDNESKAMSYLNFFKSLFPAARITFHSIVTQFTQHASKTMGEDFIALTRATGGLNFDIDALDYSDIMKGLGKDVVDFTLQYELSQTPYLKKEIEVYLNDVLIDSSLVKYLPLDNNIYLDSSVFDKLSSAASNQLKVVYFIERRKIFEL